MLSKDERNELIFICSIMTNYTEATLEKLPDEKLTEIYNNHMASAINI